MTLPSKSRTNNPYIDFDFGFLDKIFGAVALAVAAVGMAKPAPARAEDCKNLRRFTDMVR